VLVIPNAVPVVVVFATPKTLPLAAPYAGGFVVGVLNMEAVVLLPGVANEKGGFVVVAVPAKPKPLDGVAEANEKPAPGVDVAKLNTIK
jgi:hypothetical protein